MITRPAPTAAGTEPVRRHLSERQAASVDRLVKATVEELRASGYDGLQVRNVARRAGVAPATAYTYFASKDHLIAEVFWRRLKSLPAPRPDGRSGLVGRVRAAMADVGLLVADEPELAAACTTALLAKDPDVRRLRERIGEAFRRRLAVAVGEDAEPELVDALTLVLHGAFLQAGMGYLAYEDVSAKVAGVAALFVRRRS